MTIDGLTSRDPLGYGAGAVAIAERGNTTDAQSEHRSHYHQGTDDQDNEHYSSRLRNRDDARFSSCSATVVRVN
jgi:hypothetical protein